MDRNLKPRPRVVGGGNAGGAIVRAPPQSREDLAKTELHLDGLVVLKIVKHAHENPVTRGILLGLDQADHLDVTNCFPLLPDGSERQVDRYTQDMLKLLREVKIDNFNIGWYQSSPLNAFCTETFVQIHHMYQEETAGAAAIIYDPVSASLGSLFLKAYRLSDKFMAFMKSKKGSPALTSVKVAEFTISHGNILEEIPIKIHNSELAKALLVELAKSDHGVAAFTKLDLSVNPYLEKHMESLQDELDDMTGEMAQLHEYLKRAQLDKQKRMKSMQERKALNKERKKSGLEPLPEDDSALDGKATPEPSRLKALLVTKQISSYCDQINSYMTNSKIKLDLARTFQETGK